MENSWASNAALLAGIVIVIAALMQIATLLYTSLRNAHLLKSQHQASLDLLNQRVKLATMRNQSERNKVTNAWSGIRKFSIARKVIECQDICSFYLKPHDGKPLPAFEPGQYLTFQLKLPNRAKPLIRCYSLSDSPAEQNHYRISVKKAGPPPKQPEAPQGLSSNFFHQKLEIGDVIDVRAPSGKFTLDQTQNMPIVLIGGGVGITPLLSMLGAVCDSGSKRETWLFYGVRNGREKIMSDYLNQADSANENVNLRICYSNPQQSEGFVSTTINAEPREMDLVKIDESYSIGRDINNDFTIDDEKISRKHACIERLNDSYFLSDLNSSNGTYINDAPLEEPILLADKDKITVGNSSFLFRFREDVLDRDYDFNGRVSVELMKQSLASNNYEFYVCGPPPMMETIVEDLQEWGVPKAKIHFEAFGPASVKSVSEPNDRINSDTEAGFNIKFAKSDKKIKWQASDGSLLDIAEANDIEIDSGCRAGSCGTCMTALHAGEVNYLDEPEVTPDTGSCLACIAIPKSDITIDA